MPFGVLLQEAIMKKRKSTVMWGVALVLIFGFVFFLNATSFMTRPLFPKAAESHEDHGHQVSESQSREQMKQALASRRGEQGTQEASDLPNRPAILKPEFKRTEPIENETSTSGQWWRPEGRVEQKGEEIRKKRGF